MNIKKQLLFILFFIGSFSIQSQNIVTNNEKEKFSLTTSTIENQFNYVINKSGKYQEYKVVKKNWLYTLKKHVLDSLQLTKNKFQNSLKTIATQKTQITQLNNELDTSKTNISTLNNEKNSISFFGTPITKTFYNMMLWTIIIALLGFLLFFVYKFRNSNIITTKANKNFKELEMEFEDHRSRALEREQKVMRKLQDEINKQKKDNS